MVGERSSLRVWLANLEEPWPHAATVVLAGTTPRQRAWLEAKALELARELCRERPRLVLVDLAAGRSLTGLLDGGSGPGIADILSGAVPFARAVRRAEGEPFCMLPASRTPADLTGLFRNLHWAKIAAHFRGADAHLLLCVTADDWRAAGPIKGFEVSIVLNATGSDVELPRGARCQAEFPAPPDVSAYSANTRAPRPGRQRLVAIAGVAIAGLAALALWRAVGPRQIAPEPRSLQAAASAQAGGPGAGQPDQPSGLAWPSATAREENLPYSVLIASFSSIDDALARCRDWKREDIPFYIAPTAVRGVVYYRVFAGTLPDRENAAQLMEALVQDGVKESARNWDIRPARLAFGFGGYSESQEANTAIQALLVEGIPAYVVRAAGAVGDEILAYRVYAGAYEKPEDARPLREQIARSRLDADLVERVGVYRR